MEINRCFDRCIMRTKFFPWWCAPIQPLVYYSIRGEENDITLMRTVRKWCWSRLQYRKKGAL